MNRELHTAVLILIMTLVTWMLRALPFWLFRRKTPAVVAYLGRVLPAAIIGMLVIYCLKDVRFTAAPYGIPEILAGVGVAGLQWWKRNSLISILGGTALYMLLIRLAF